MYQPTWTTPFTTQPSPMVAPTVTMPAYQQPVNGITKVNGRDSALQYQLPPNSTSPALFDKDGTCFYVVSTDGTGAKTVETFDFSPRKPQPQPAVTDYVSRDEFDRLVSRIDGMIGATNGPDATVRQQPAAQQPAGQPAVAAPADARK